MERENKEIITPIGKDKVVIKAWLTGREKRELRRPFFEGVQFDVPEQGMPKIKELKNSAQMIEQAEDMAIQTIVVSINGDNKNILEKVLEMRDKDYNFIVQEINKISQDTDFPMPKTKQ